MKPTETRGWFCFGTQLTGGEFWVFGVPAAGSCFGAPVSNTSYTFGVFVANTVDTFGAVTGSIFGANPAETGGRLVWGFGTIGVAFGGTSAPAFAPLSSFK